MLYETNVISRALYRSLSPFPPPPFTSTSLLSFFHYQVPVIIFIWKIVSLVLISQRERSRVGVVA